MTVSLLSYWLLLLAQRKAYPCEMKAAVGELSQNTISIDENSIYRALKRLAQSGEGGIVKWPDGLFTSPVFLTCNSASKDIWPRSH